MYVLIPGKVLDLGSMKGRKGELVTWVKLYQRNGDDRPGETADLWFQDDPEVKVGQDVTFQASVRAESQGPNQARLRVVGARLIER